MMMENDGWLIDDDDVFGFAVFIGADSFNSDLSKWNTERVKAMRASKLFLFVLYKRISLTISSSSLPHAPTIHIPSVYGSRCI